MQELANRSSFEGVEAGGRFVQHNAARVRNKLHTDRATFAFTAREDLAMNTTNLTVLNMEQTQLSYDTNHIGILFHFRRRQLKASRESHSLNNREVREEDIVLHHVSSIAGESILNHGHYIVEHDIARKGSFIDQSNTIRENV